MDAVTPASRTSSESGFSLVEVMVAMFILTVGVLSLVAVLAMAVRAVSGSSYRLIAREKAREAIESVHAARDTGRVSWPDINNVSNDGIFLDGENPLRQAGEDGIVNTADDAEADFEVQLKPGPDGILGTADDVELSLGEGFSREILIEPIVTEDEEGNPIVSQTLRQITVTIRYLTEGTMRTYSLRTYISSYS